MGISQAKKLQWFDLGARALTEQRGAVLDREFGLDRPPVYMCPLCTTLFGRGAVADGRLTVEHVPPEAVGGRELVLTCKPCNDRAGAVLDAHAKRKEDVLGSIRGHLDRSQKVKVTVDGVTLNARLATENKTYSLTIPTGINRPSTEEAFQGSIKPQSKVDIHYSGDAFAELGAKISWLRAGYLVLFARFGYSMILDRAFRMPREQILEPMTAKTRCFTLTIPEAPDNERALWHITTPAESAGLGVQFGQYVVLFPLSGDVSFYERLADSVTTAGVTLSGGLYDWPLAPTFGLTFDERRTP